MDHNYGCEVTNKFSLFLDDEDPLDILSRQEESKSKKKDGDKKGSKKPKKAAPAPEVKKAPETGFKKDDKPAPRSDRGRGGFRNRENRDFQDGERRPQGFRQGPRENRGFDENTPPEFRERREGGFGRRDGEGGFGERGRGGRGRGGRGRGEGRGGFGPRGGFRGGFGGDRRREFDRHSGNDRTSGVKAFDKREGGGAHNWGTFKDDVEGQEQDHQNDSADWSGQQPDTPEKATENGDANHDEGEEGPKAEPEPVELTLDEWKALNSGKATSKPEFKIREISKWTGTKGFEYHKKDDKEESEEEESEEEEEEEDPRQKKIYSDIRITFNENPQRGGRGRGGRGRGEGRGGRGRGDDRGDRGGFDGGRGRGGFGGRGGRGGGNKPREAAPRFDDEADFPSLVKLAA